MTVSQAKEMYPWLQQFEDNQIWIHDGIITIDDGAEADYTFEEVDSLSEPYRIQSQPDSSEDEQESREDLDTSSADSDTEESREEPALTDLDSSSFGGSDDSFHAAVIQYDQDTLTELQRIEGYSVSILYTLYIIIGIFLGYWLIKAINYFTR